MNDINIPIHIGIIMDGNGRWAKERGLNRSLGHKAGADNLLKLIPYIFNRGIKYISVYALSKENFKRDIKEIDFLMNLFVKMFKTKKKIFIDEKIKVIFSGEKSRIRKDVISVMEKIEEDTKNFTDKIFNVCLSYSGREEIAHAVKRIVEDKHDISLIDEELVGKYMYHNLPDLDLVIRTSGEQRISNFMLWQSSYAEYAFPMTYFPAFNSEEFEKVLFEYNNRERRFGNAK